MKKLHAGRLQHNVNEKPIHSTLITSFKGKNDMAAKAEAPTITAQTIKAAQEALSHAPSMTDAPGVDKIRELLFGNQMQDYDRRFSVMEELESLANQIRHEQDLRAEADKELGRGLREQIQGLEKQLSKVADQLANQDRDFTERLSHESQTLREESRRRTDETRAAIERMLAELMHVKTDRSLLAGLFVEIARCLNQDTTAKANGGNGQRA
jgi:hypothetical protein